MAAAVPEAAGQVLVAVARHVAGVDAIWAPDFPFDLNWHHPSRHERSDSSSEQMLAVSTVEVCVSVMRESDHVMFRDRLL